MAGFFIVLKGTKKRPDRKNSDPVFENSCKKLLLSGNDLKVGKFDLLAELLAESLFDGFIAHVIQLDGNHFGTVDGVDGCVLVGSDFCFGVVDSLVAVIDHERDYAGDDSEEEAATVEDQNSRINLSGSLLPFTLRMKKCSTRCELKHEDSGESDQH